MDVGSAPALEDEDDGRRDDEVILQAGDALDTSMDAYEDLQEWQEDEGTGAKAGSGEENLEEKEVVAATSPKGAARGAALAAGADGEEAASFEGGSKAAAVADHGGSDAVVEEQQGGGTSRSTRRAAAGRCHSHVAGEFSQRRSTAPVVRVEGCVVAGC